MTGTAATAIETVPSATTGAMTGVPNARSATIDDGPPATTGGAARVVGTIGVEEPHETRTGAANAMGMASSSGLPGMIGRAVNAVAMIGAGRTGSGGRSGSMANRLRKP